MDAKVAEVVDVPCRGKIAASDDCDIKPMKTRTKLPEGCIEVIFTQYWIKTMMDDKNTRDQGWDGILLNYVIYPIFFCRFHHIRCTSVTKLPDIRTTFTLDKALYWYINPLLNSFIGHSDRWMPNRFKHVVRNVNSNRVVRDDHILHTSVFVIIDNNFAWYQGRSNITLKYRINLQQYDYMKFHLISCMHKIWITIFSAKTKQLSRYATLVYCTRYFNSWNISFNILKIYDRWFW